MKQRAQSFTSLMADLRQDINRVSSFNNALMEHFLEGIALLRHWYNGTLTQMRRVTNTIFLFRLNFPKPWKHFH